MEITEIPQVSPPDFALALYRRYARGEDTVLLSPTSILIALRALMLGARGETAAGIARVLAGGEDRGEGAPVITNFPDPFIESNGQTLLLALGVWLDQRLLIAPSYRDAAESDRRVEWFDTDFTNREAARARINGWTEERTKGRIRNLLGPRSIDETTRFVLTSALHFRAKWSEPFEKEATVPLPFTRADGSQVQTSMMRSTMKRMFARGEGGRMLQLGYENSFVFQAFLPDSPSGLERLEAQLTPTALRTWTDSLERREVDIWLPKFQLEGEYDLATELSVLGMASAFDSARADFSGIGRSPDGLPLSLGTAVHRTFIDVNEHETEAAAATALVGITMGMRRAPEPPKKEEFHADHPFLYLIRSAVNGSILFIGRMTGR